MAGATTERWVTTGTASVAAIRPMISYAAGRGVSVEAVLGAIGLSLASLSDFDRRIPEAGRARAWIDAAERSGDPAFGLHAAASLQMGAFDVLDYSLYFSETLGDALGRILRFHRVLCDAWAATREDHSGVSRVRRTERTPAAEAESSLAFLVLRARDLTGEYPIPSEVRFAHPPPPDTSPHEELFRCPVRFGCPATELVFPTDKLALRVATANAGVVAVLDRYMGEMLARLPRDDTFVERVRSVVASGLHAGRPDLSATARRLHASPRTVQRRLREHGTTYAEIVELIRRDLGERLVAEGRLSVTEIAFLLGFRDVGGFRRVYKRWTGTSPSRGRAAHGTEPAVRVTPPP